MVTYSYIPPEYKTTTKMASTSSDALLSQPLTTTETKEPRIPYRDSGAAGKSIFGQASSWTYKPLPPFPFETEDSTKQPLLSRFREEECGDLTEVGEDMSQFLPETKEETKIQKMVKNFSKRFSATASKT